MIQPAVTLQRSQSYCVRVLICASVTVWMLYVVRPPVCVPHTQEEECVGVTSVQWEEEEEEGDLSTIWAWWWWRLLLLLLNVDHVKDLMLREAWTLVMFCVYLDLLVHVKQRAKAWTHHRITAVQKQKHHTDTTLKTAANNTSVLLGCSGRASFCTCSCVYLHLWGHLCKLFANHFVSMWSFCIFPLLYA